MDKKPEVFINQAVELLIDFIAKFMQHHKLNEVVRCGIKIVRVK